MDIVLAAARPLAVQDRAFDRAAGLTRRSNDALPDVQAIF